MFKKFNIFDFWTKMFFFVKIYRPLKIYSLAASDCFFFSSTTRFSSTISTFFSLFSLIVVNESWSWFLWCSIFFSAFSVSLIPSEQFLTSFSFSSISSSLVDETLLIRSFWIISSLFSFIDKSLVATSSLAIISCSSWCDSSFLLSLF